jgi:hypothetical protein
MLLCLHGAHSQSLGDVMIHIYWLSEAPVGQLRPYFPKIWSSAHVDYRLFEQHYFYESQCFAVV